MKEGTALDIIEKSHLFYSLNTIGIRRLLYLEEAPADIYSIRENESYELIFPCNSPLSKKIISTYIGQGHLSFFVKAQDIASFEKAYQDLLRVSTKNLSKEDPIKSANDFFNILTICLEYFYENPMDDKLLNALLPSLKALVSFLLKNIKLSNVFYSNYLKQGHYYIYAHPLISSIFLLGVLRQDRFRDYMSIENLFIANYLKDIGMSVIPFEYFSLKELSTDQKRCFQKHTENSLSILEKRLTLKKEYFEVISSHHTVGLLEDNFDEFINSNNKIDSNIILVNMVDLVSALISDRPFREKISLFRALQIMRALIQKKYPIECKNIITYFKNYFF